MDEIKVNAFFLSEKISKIRWVPEQFKESEKFLTGSWDGAVNHVKLWRLNRNQYSEESNEYVPVCCDKIQYKSDITGLEFIDSDNIVVSSTDGYVTMVNVKRAVDLDILTNTAQSELLHKFCTGTTAPCTALSVFGNDIATVGEDGRLNVIAASAVGLTSIKTIENADNCSLTSVSYINPKEILTANRMGVIKMFDIRSESIEPTAILYISCEDAKKSNYVSGLTYHPTQKHIILAGSEEGSITVWDLRQPSFPASYIMAHNSAITEIGFHKTQPTKLFTTSENGELWQWSQNTLTMSSVESHITMPETENINPWLNGERVKSRMSVMPLIAGLKKAINTFDAQNSKIICGCDSEAVYCFDNVV